MSARDVKDVIVLGLGGMGSAAAAHLARRGHRVLGLEQFTPAHDRGSSHGETRMIRQAYFEDPAYVPLLLRSYELWEQLDRERPGILTITGGLMIGTAESAAVRGSVASARRWDLPYELLDAGDLRRRFPEFAPGKATVALYERWGGFVRPEEAVRAHLKRAEDAGADLRFGTRVVGWDVTPSGGVTVWTAAGTWTAGALVIAPGAWAPHVLPEFAAALIVERQAVFWFQPVGGVGPFRPPAHPVFLWEDTSGMQLYGFPACGRADEGVKVSFFRNGTAAKADDLDREIRADEVEDMRQYLASRIPALPGRYLRGLACMYTTTPDQHFIVAVDPRRPQVSMAAGFSGHGFKFVPVIGEILADLAVTGTTAHDVGLFSPGRLTSPAGHAQATTRTCETEN